MKENNLSKALEVLTENVKTYRNCEISDGNTMLVCLQQITGTLFYLETLRSKYHEQFQNVINTKVLEGESVARSENEAHKQVPEMYMLRHIMTSGYEVVGAIRTTISFIKIEISNSNNNQSK